MGMDGLHPLLSTAHTPEETRQVAQVAWVRTPGSPEHLTLRRMAEGDLSCLMRLNKEVMH